MTDDQGADSLMDRLAQAIDRNARAGLDQLMAHLQAGVDPRVAIDQVQASFTGVFADALRLSFSQLLAREVGRLELMAMPVGDVPLSSRLYRHAQQTVAEVTALVREHAKGVQQARELSLRLYDGYSPGDGVARPLEGRARAELPKAIRALTGDSQTRRSLGRLIEQGRAQAQRLKTPALRAAYEQAFDAWEAGEGTEALRRKLDVAWREKNRYMANRIAQTELARAHQAQVGGEIMADAGITVAQVIINPSHPRTDICDLHARADLFGLGPGCYPKERAPVPPFHPYCRCKLRSRPSLVASEGRVVPGGVGAYLRSMPKDQAARIVGSADRLQAVLGGKGLDEVLSNGLNPDYGLRRLGQGAGHALVPVDETRRIDGPSAFDIAREGGSHHGMLVNIRNNLGPNQLRAGIAKLSKQIADHESWILDPKSKPGVELHRDEDIARWVQDKWPSDIARLKAQRTIYEGVLKEKEDGNGSGDS